MAAPSVYAAINAVSNELARSGISKTHTNAVDGYKYRSIDDVLNRLAPLLAQHRLCVLPRVLDRETIDRHDEMERSLFHVSLRVAFSLTSVDDGSSHVVESFGEALDPSDKATAKAMSAAYKSAMLQTFCIPCSGAEEPDLASYRVAARTHVLEPVQGWLQWATDIEEILSVSESEQAVSLVQERNRELLQGLRRERPELYVKLGAAFARRRNELNARKRTRLPQRQSARAKQVRSSGASSREQEDE